MDGKITLKMFYCRPKIATQLFLFFFFLKKKEKRVKRRGEKRENIISKPLAYF